MTYYVRTSFYPYFSRHLAIFTAIYFIIDTHVRQTCVQLTKIQALPYARLDFISPRVAQFRATNYLLNYDAH